MSLLHAALLGIIEGITEFLPISSTGHLIVASHLLGLTDSDFLKSFEIFIQLGAILSVIVLYWKKFLMEFEVLKRVIVAFIPTGIIGFILYKLIKQYLLGSTAVVLWSLFLGGIALIVFEHLHTEDASATKEVAQISYRNAFVIGIVQSLAVIPGVSRSAATIVGGLMLGVSRKTIIEFSFLLAVPTMLAASGYDLLKSSFTFSSDQYLALSIGFVVAFAVALGSIRLLLSFVRNHTFTAFGIYRIAAAAMFWFVLR